MKSLKQIPIKALNEDANFVVIGNDGLHYLKAMVKVEQVDRRKKNLIFKLDDLSRSQISEMISRNAEVIFFQKTGRIAFYAENLSIEGEYLCIPLILNYCLRERRSWKRLIALNADRVLLKTGNKITTVKVHDIAEGGFSFVIAQSANILFKKGEKLKEMILLLDDVKIKLEATIVSRERVTPYTSAENIFSGWRISVKIPTESQEYCRIIKKRVEQLNFIHENMFDIRCSPNNKK